MALGHPAPTLSRKREREFNPSPLWGEGRVRGKRLNIPKMPNSPDTQATKMLRQHNVAFTAHLYDYEEHGGTKVSARELGVEEFTVVKTLLMEDENAKPLVVLMHGTHKVSTKELARAIGVKRIEPCKPEIAQKHSGYRVGGTSPFGTKKSMPVYMEKTILDLPKIFINGGRRGYLVGIAPQEVVSILQPTIVQVGQAQS